MNNKLTIQERMITSIVYFLIILSVGYYLNGSFEFLTKSSNHLNTLFVASALMLIMGSYITEPYFTKPVDVIAKTFSILLILFGISKVSDFIFYDIFLYFNVVLLLLSIVLIFIQQMHYFVKAQRVIYYITTKIAQPEIIFSMLYLLTLFSFYLHGNTNEFILLFGMWLILIFKKPVEILSKWIIKLMSFVKTDSSNIIPIGEAIGCENPFLYTVELDFSKNKGQILSNGDLVYIDTQDNLQLIGIVINEKHLLNKKWFSIYLLNDEHHQSLSITANTNIDKNSIFSSFNQVHKIELNNIAEDIKQNILENYMYKNRMNIIGYIAKDSNINKVKFNLIINEQKEEHRTIGEGSILVSKIFNKETLFQIIDGNTTEEILTNKDIYGFTTVLAKKVGYYNVNTNELDTVKWLPSIYTPVFLHKNDTTAEFDHSKFIGKLPNTNYGIPIKEYNSLVTHNTAILGILGIGKSRLTFELIKKIIDNTNVKVICIDITNQYANELNTYINENLINTGLSPLTRKTLKMESSKIGSASNQKSWGNVNYYHKKLQGRIKAFERSNKRVLIFNPDLHKVNKARATFKIEYADDLTTAEKTRIISEQIFINAMRQGETDEARFLLVYEEAHSLIPEWNSASNIGDQSASNGTAKVILQGRKYGLGSFVVTQRTANISKSILNQCNTIFALRIFDDTGKQFLENYIGSDYANVLPTLEERHCIAVGKAMRLKQPIILKLNNTADVIANGE
jgi:hypothetical protein